MADSQQKLEAELQALVQELLAASAAAVHLRQRLSGTAHASSLRKLESIDKAVRDLQSRLDAVARTHRADNTEK